MTKAHTARNMISQTRLRPNKTHTTRTGIKSDLTTTIQGDHRGISCSLIHMNGHTGGTLTAIPISLATAIRSTTATDILTITAMVVMVDMVTLHTATIVATHM
jgi:hypothetical protein